MGDGGRGSTTARTRLVVAVVGVVLLVVLAVLLPRLTGDDESSSAGAPSATTAPRPTDEAPSDAPAPGEPNDGASAPSSAPSDGAEGSGGSGGSGEGDAPDEGEADNRPPLRVAIDEAVRPTDALTVTVARVEEVRSQAELPGETSRPALRLTVRVTNTSDRAVPIGGALTNLYYGSDRTAATLVQRPGGRPFPAEVQAGGSATSVVVYNVPPAARDRVVLEVSLDATIRRVEFNGSCADGC